MGWGGVVMGVVVLVLDSSRVVFAFVLLLVVQ